MESQFGEGRGRYYVVQKESQREAMLHGDKILEWKKCFSNQVACRVGSTCENVQGRTMMHGKHSKVITGPSVLASKNLAAGLTIDRGCWGLPNMALAEKMGL
eukprot:1160743-Pelagomonas_calceolata.AAC.5